jgi:photosystem II stability/assembly factor-like uncharacterized protein
MLRSLSIAGAATGIAAALSVACSGTFSPSTLGDQSGASRKKSAADAPLLTPQQSNTTQRLQAVSPVNHRIVWASGVGGTFVVTTDGGQTWRAGVVSDHGVAQTQLEFRDVHGVSAKVAYLLASGEGEASRIYKTEDGGATWTRQFTNPEPAAFYDCFDFWTPNRGVTFSDPVNGSFPIIRTTDGRTWQFGGEIPPALAGEFGFAASGTCVATQGGQRAWIATGGAATARILATTDRGNSWKAYPTPIPSGPSGGAFTVAFRDPLRGIVAGGDLGSPDAVVANNVARSSDGGRSWSATDNSAPIAGAIFGLSYVPSQGRQRVVATGPAGTAWSADEGDNWSSIGGLTGFWAVAFATQKAGWLVGTGGRIVKVSF